nr:histidinol dehydrogenase [Nocardia bovistercoris]
MLEQRAQDNLEAVEATVRTVVDAVRAEGDAAVVRFTAEFDRATLSPSEMRVSEAEFEAAEKLVDDNLRAAIARSIENIGKHHRAQLPRQTWMEEVVPGVLAGERVTPIDSVGLYVPRGKGSFPSVMMMLCVPAIIAEVPEIVVCTPPGPDGTVDAASLVTARLCGVRHVIKVGGAQAIAAMAYGTETVPKVDKILGPGNQYVTAARRMLAGVVNPGPPAGPSESVVLCDGDADVLTVARELLVEAEHGEDSAVLLVTDSAELADGVIGLLDGLVAELPDRRRANCTAVFANYGGVVITASVAESVDFVNAYAPEHLRVLVRDPFELLPSIKHAGEVLLGEYASIPYGNFSIGVNAILPTGRNARTYSCMGVEELMKRSSFAYVSADGARRIGPGAVELAAYEGFPAHEAAARHVLERVEKADAH